MEHIVTIAFDFDDKTVSDKIEASAAKAVIDKIVHDVAGRIFTKNGWGGGKIDPQRDQLSSFTERIVRDFLEDNKDNVIEKAAVMLADSYKRTKAWKEKAAEQTEG